jgi:hypothetical protein
MTCLDCPSSVSEASARWRLFPQASLAAVFVVAAQPHLGRVSFVAAERGAVEEAVVDHHELQAAGGGGVGQGRRFRRRGRRCSSPGSRTGRRRARCHSRRRTGRRPGGTPPASHPGDLFRGRFPRRSCSRLRRRRPTGSSSPSGPCMPAACPAALGGAGEHHIPGVQVGHRTVEAVGDRGAGRAARGVGRAEHEVVDDQLRPPSNSSASVLGPVIGVEAVLLVDRHRWAGDAAWWRAGRRGGSVPSPLPAARYGRQATPHVFRSCDWLRCLSLVLLVVTAGARAAGDALTSAG